MKVAVTGATGQVGHWIVEDLLAAGHEVTALGRRPAAQAHAAYVGYALDGPPPDLTGQDALVHAAFAHVPGRYRGGEGDDPEVFRALNFDGTLRLFEAARCAGVGRILFLSSRAAYGDYPPGTSLSEDLPARPDTLYGQIKRDAEVALLRLAGPSLAVASLRATGVYACLVPGQRHKWGDLFDDFDAGRPIAPRTGTEVYAPDLAHAVRLLLECDKADLSPGIFNVSDILLDRRDLLSAYAEACGMAGTLPLPADPATASVMTTDRIAALGWRPSGRQALGPVVEAIAHSRAG